MKNTVLTMVLSLIFTGLFSQTITVQIKESAGNCLLGSNCEENTVCFDLLLKINEPNWELRSYNIWFQYPVPPALWYNSDNSCVVQNGGDTDNNQNGQYRVSGINGSFPLLPGVDETIHTICFQYGDASQVVGSFVKVGGSAVIFGFPFQSTLTLINNTTGETSGIILASMDSTAIELENNQNIDVAMGWSGVSSRLQPFLPGIEQIMSPVVDDVVIFYNLVDGIYYPANGINTLQNWNYKSGYIIKTTSNISFGFCGHEGENKTVNLMAGWNIIPVLSDEQVPVEDVFASLGNNLVLVKEIAGYRLYYPNFSISTLSQLEPTKSYFVKVIEPCTITFPAYDGKNSQSQPVYQFDWITPWNEVYETPGSHVFCFRGNYSLNLEMGDIIGAFDQNGLCSGIMEILDENQAFAVPVFGDDANTGQKDGLSPNELITLRLFKTSTGEVFNLSVEFDENSPQQANYVQNGISLIKNVWVSSLGFHINGYVSGMELNIYPNPTHGEFDLELAGDKRIDGKMVLTDSRGQLLTIKPLSHSSYNTLAEFDLSNHSPGVYYLRIISKNYYAIRKIVRE